MLIPCSAARSPVLRVEDTTLEWQGSGVIENAKASVIPAGWRRIGLRVTWTRTSAPDSHVRLFHFLSAVSRSFQRNAKTRPSPAR